MYNVKSQHIRRRHNNIQQLISNDIISIDYVKSKENLADLLTTGTERSNELSIKRNEIKTSNLYLVVDI